MAKTVGKPGPPPKAAEDRQRRAKPSLISLERAQPSKPARPPKLGTAGSALWTAFWSSDNARAITEVDHDLVVRLCRLRDLEEEALSVLARDGVLATGSKGQPRTHPAVEVLVKLEAAMRSLGAELGLSPYSRMKLLGTSARAAADWTEIVRRSG